MAAPPRVVPGEASESDSEPELLGGASAGVGAALGTPPGAGLKVPGEASETEDEEEEEEEEEEGGARGPRAPPAPRAEEQPPLGPGGRRREGPSLLQQRLREGSGRLRGAVGSALRGSYGGAARLLGGLGGALGRAQADAAAAAHCLRLAQRDLRALATAIDIVATCRLLPDIRGALPGR